MSDSNSSDRGAPWAQAVAQDLNLLRRLADQLRRSAASSDDQVIRTILGKREALLSAIRRRMDAEAAPARADVADDEKCTMVRTVAEISEMDRESLRLLNQRAVAVAAEIQKLRAGKKWRESCPT